MTIELTVLIAILGFVISYQTYQLNKNKESRSDVRQNTRIETQLEAIGKGVDDIRIAQRANEKNTQALTERVTRVEESAKQAHKRIDNIQGGEKVMQELLNEYIVEQALIVIPVLLILGAIIKGTPRFKDWTIPYILLVLGVVFTVALVGFNVDSIIQGILVSGAAVFGNQLYKQAKNKDVE